ncbi:MAG: TetR/AcrR family transcriptional regulator [Thermoleophilaceae bacterium]
MEARMRNPRGQGDRLRIALIDAASDVLAEVGDLSALSVRRVTARAGVSANALYLHFADMGELAVAVKQRGFDELRAALGAAERANEGDPFAQFRASCRAYVEFALDHPARYRIIFGTPIPHAKVPALNGPEAEGDSGAAAFNDLVRAVERCLGGAGDTFEIAVQIWTGLHGYASLLPVMGKFPFPGLDDFVAGLEAAHLRAPAQPDGAAVAAERAAS